MEKSTQKQNVLSPISTSEQHVGQDFKDEETQKIARNKEENVEQYIYKSNGIVQTKRRQSRISSRLYSVCLTHRIS